MRIWGMNSLQLCTYYETKNVFLKNTPYGKQKTLLLPVFSGEVQPINCGKVLKISGTLR